MWLEIGLSFAILAVIFVAAWIIVAVIKRKRRGKAKVEVEQQKLDVLMSYVQNQQAADEEKRRLKELRSAELKSKLETFKRTKDELKDRLRDQLDAKDWVPLSRILAKVDKGNMGVYVLYNATKDKYYVGQAKEIFTRIKKHFDVEPIARDFMSGDNIQVKFLTASEMDADYRIDHIEKTGIEIFASKELGYNRKEGNL